MKIDNLTFGYHKNKLIYDNFNLKVKSGEVVAIVGPSGSGKTTLFELITKNLKPFSGEINSQNCSFIFQDPYTSFHQTYSIINQIEDVAKIENIDTLLCELDLDKELILKKPYELSGGQLQRCSILRAILMKPKLLLCDEPTSALDNITALNVMKLLMKYLDRLAIVLITHDEDLAKWCSDEIIDLKKAI